MRNAAKQVLMGVLILVVAPGLLLAQPTSVSYQGQLEKDGSPHNGQADLKFVIVDGGASLWSNDGTSTNGQQPTGFVTLDVDHGLFEVLLGGAGMQPLTADFLAGATNPQLRIWVRAPAGTGAFEQLTDQAIASVPFSLRTTGGGTGGDGHSLDAADGEPVDALYVDDSGRVGIGTVAPGVALHVYGDTDADMVLEIPASATANLLEYRMRVDGIDRARMAYSKSTNDLTLENEDAGGVVVRTGGLTRVVVDEDGYTKVRASATLADDWGGLIHHQNAAYAWREMARGTSSASSGILRFSYVNLADPLDVVRESVLQLRGDGHVIVPVLEIAGGDLVEPFELSDDGGQPGTVLVIDSTDAGKLRTSYMPYDQRIAGVVSGAGGLEAGIHMGRDCGLGGDTPVAMTGRVYVKCITENGPIAPGDLLTTSSVPGHAMRATDQGRSHGSVLGKAMTTLEAGQGLVLVIVNLQ